MTSCGDGHLFCLDCAKRNAESVVGSGGFRPPILHIELTICRYIFKCMDFSGCKAEFPAFEINRFADEKVLALRDKFASEAAIREVPPPV
jgi:E3 ubiquitin-protein ligase RNF216